MVSRRKNPHRYALLLALVPFFALSLETAAAIEAKEGTAGESELPLPGGTEQGSRCASIPP